MDNMPTWAKMFYMDANEFTRKADGHFELNRYNALKEISPGLYEAAGNEVKEFNEYHRYNGNSFDKVKLGRKIGSITLNDYVMHPELKDDEDALKKYWELHPELRAERYNKYGNLANGSGFDLRKADK